MTSKPAVIITGAFAGIGAVYADPLRQPRPCSRATPPMMGVDELVDAALAGFDQHETVTIPVLAEAVESQPRRPNDNRLNHLGRRIGSHLRYSEIKFKGDWHLGEKVISLTR